MKKRNKSYNPLKFVQTNNERLLRNFAVCYFVNDETPKQDIILTNLNGDRMPVTKTVAQAIQYFPYQWSVMLCAFCIEKGEPSCKMKLVTFNTRYYQKDLVEFLNDEHQAFFKSLRDKNVNLRGGGWCASAVGRDFDEEEVGNIFDKLGAF